MTSETSTFRAAKPQHGQARPASHSLAAAALMAVVAYSMLLAARPLLHPPLRAVTAFIGNAAAGLVPGHVQCSLHPTLRPKGELDLTLHAVNTTVGIQGSLPMSSELFFTIPLFLALTLAVATPALWKHRGFIALAGTVLMLLVAGVRFWIAAAALALSPSLAGEAITPWLHSAFDVLADVLVRSPSAAYVPPFLTWACLVLMLRRPIHEGTTRSTRVRGAPGS